MEFSANNWKSPKYGLMLVGILVLGAVIIVSIIRDRIVNQPQWQINVAGQGRVTYQPDLAKINLGVQVDKAAKAEDALKQLNDKMNRILDAVKKGGIAAEDIQTQNYSLNPAYDTVNNINKLAGYNANQIVIVKVRDIQKNSGLIAKVISDATKAGANQINGVAFEYADMNKLRQDARLLAIADARKKSEEISKALDVKLGKIVGWWENIVSPLDIAGNYTDGKGGAAGVISGTPEIPTGSQEVVIEVNINYQID